MNAVVREHLQNRVAHAVERGCGDGNERDCLAGCDDAVENRDQHV